MTPPKQLKNFPSMSYRAVNDGKWSIEFISDGCREILGFSAEQLHQQGKTCLPDILVHSKNSIADDAVQMEDDKHSFQFEYILETPNGDERRVIERGHRVFDDAGTLLAIDGFVTDVTEQGRLSNEFAYQSQHDRLTGLPDRWQFEVTAKNVLTRPDSADNAHSMLYIDLDQFELFGESNESSIGDELLRQVAARLHTVVRGSDSLARLGKHEFGLLLIKCDLGDAAHIATMICNAIEQHKFKCQKRHYSLTASIGVATTTEGLDSFEELLSAADLALYAAKDCGRNRVHYYLQQNLHLLQQNQEIHWALEIPQALAENRFYLEQQLIEPIGEITSSKIWYEVLLRLQDVDGKIIMPDRFLTAAENYNLAVTFDIWVIETLLQKLTQEPELLHELGLCFINVSAQSIGDSAFLEKLCLLLQQSQIPADRLCFEITETAAVANIDDAMIMMQRLQGLGCRIALDNFGNGFSSFGYLRDFPVDFIKIDGELIRDMTQDRVNRSIVASIKELGHANNKQIIAVSVESDEILDQLLAIGVDYVQGNAIAQPGPFSISLAENLEVAS